MIDFDVPQRSAENAESRTGSAQSSNRFLVDMANPETRSSFSQSTDNTPSVVSDSGHLLFNSTDIYGGSQGRLSVGNESNNSATAENPVRVGSNADFPMRRPAAGTDGINTPAALEPSTASSLGSFNAGAEISSASPSSLGTDSAQATAATDAPAPTITSAANLTPEQAAINQSIVQLSTPMLTVNPDGTFTESNMTGTGFLFTGADGNQYIGTAGHVVGATGQDNVNVNGPAAYAEGPTTVTFADGTQTTATVNGNNSLLPRDNYVETGGPTTDAATLTMDYPGPTLPHPSLPLDSNATPSPGDTLNTVGFGNGQLTGMSTTYLGQVTPLEVATNSSDTEPMLATANSAIHGMSGGPMVDSNGNFVGFVTMGSSPTDGTIGTTLETPISAIANINQAQSILNPNWLSNTLNYTPQPIASLDDHGNGSDQSFTGFTVTNGQNIDLHIPATPPADATPAITPPAATPPADIPATTPAPPADIPATPTAAPPDATPTAPPITDITTPTPATDPTDIAASDDFSGFGGYYAGTFGGDAGYGGGDGI